MISIRSVLGGFFSKRKLAILLLGGILLSVGNFLFVGGGKVDTARAGEEIVINGKTYPVGEKMDGNIEFGNDPSTADKDEYIKIKWKINKPDIDKLKSNGYTIETVEFLVKSGMSQNFTYSGLVGVLREQGKGVCTNPIKNRQDTAIHTGLIWLWQKVTKDTQNP